MKLMKYSLVILSILLILLVFASSASAADNSETDVIPSDEKLALDYSADTSDESNDTNVVENDENNLLSENNKLSSDIGNWSDLQKLIDEAGDGGNITLKMNYILDKNVKTNKQLTIYGNGHYIKSSGSTDMILTFSAIYLYNITFIGGNVNGFGGAVCCDSTVEVHNCVYINNTASSGGGAIFSTQSVSVFDSKFINNAADYGGAITCNTIYCSNCTFYENYAQELAGAIYAGDCVIENSQFINNTAEEFVGSIFVSGYLSITNSLITSYDKMELVDICNEIYVEGGGLYLFNNTMYCPNPGQIWFESQNQILSPVYLVFAYYDNPQSGKIKIATLLDSDGNSIRVDSILLKIYDGDTLIDQEQLSYDNGFYYNCSLSEGVYRLTGSLGDGIATDVTVMDGKLTVGSQLIISAPDLTKYYRGPEKFAVTVTDGKNNPLANKSVNITINGVTYTRTTDGNGTASLNINLNSGEYPVNVAVDDKKVNSTVIVKATIDASDIVKVFRNNTQYYATFVDVNGNPLDHAMVSFNINGRIYNDTTDKYGIGKLNINLGAGEYIITAFNSVTGEMKSNSIKVISLIESSDLTKYYKNDSQFVVRIHSDNGSYVGTGEEVKFNINGRFYTCITNATGHATLNINLPQDNYIVTTYYKDCSQGNAIEVLPILNATDLEMKYQDGSQFKAKLVDGKGNAYPNQNVTFNINGVFYNMETDSNGVAKLDINLMPGEYIVTSSYNGSNIANKITIKS